MSGSQAVDGWPYLGCCLAASWLAIALLPPGGRLATWLAWLSWPLLSHLLLAAFWLAAAWLAAWWQPRYEQVVARWQEAATQETAWWPGSCQEVGAEKVARWQPQASLVPGHCLSGHLLARQQPRVGVQ